VAVLTSTLHQAIAAIAEYLEDEFAPELFTFRDGGTTLEIYAEALNQISFSNEWQRLVTDYEHAGGTVYCSDGEVA
jgi:glutathione S-transferase